MALVDEISVKLGIDSAEFKAALTDANATIKGFKATGTFGEEEGLGGTIKGINHKMREFKELLVAGGIIEVVKRFFDSAIEAANKQKDSLDENVQAVQRFGKSWEGIKEGVAGISVAILGFFNQAGEGWGTIINRMKGVTLAQETLIESIQKETDAQAVRFKLANDIAKVKRDSAFEEADLLGKARILLQDNVALEIQISKLKLGTLEYAKLDAEIRQNVFKAGELIAQQEAKTAEAKKKSDEELNKIKADGVKYGKESVALDQQLAKIAFDKLTPEKQLAVLVKEKARLMAEIKNDATDENQIKRDKVALDKIEKQILDNKAIIQNREIVPGTKEEREEQERITAELEKQKGKIKEKADAQRMFISITSKNGDGAVTGLSDRELQEKIDNLRKLQQKDQDARNKGNIVYTDTSRLDAAVAEQNQRQQFMTLAKAIGEEAALKQFSAFDESKLRSYFEGTQSQQKTLDALTDIKNHIAAAFPLNG